MQVLEPPLPPTVRGRAAFSADEMTSDPAPPAPVVSLAAAPDDPPPTEKSSRASEWFAANRVQRVPVIALEPDVYRLPGQSWAIFSMIRPEEYRAAHHQNREYHGYLIKFRGVFATRDEAEAHIKKLMQIDRHFDIHMVPAFSWAGIDDDCVEDRAYANEMISSVMKGFFENENARMSRLRDRIRDTEMHEEVGARSEEASRFFEEAQRAALGASAPVTSGAAVIADAHAECSELETPAVRRARPIAPPPGLEKAVSLDALAAEFGLTPGGRARAAPVLERGAAEAIVQTQLLDD